MLGFSIKSADFFYPRGLNLEAWGFGVKSHIKQGYWFMFVYVSFFSVLVTGSVSFSSLHLDAVKKHRRC